MVTTHNQTSSGSLESIVSKNKKESSVEERELRRIKIISWIVIGAIFLLSMALVFVGSLMAWEFFPAISCGVGFGVMSIGFVGSFFSSLFIKRL